MMNAGGVVVDTGLYETSSVIREALQMIRPGVAHLGAGVATDEFGSDTNVVVAGVRRSAGYGPADLVRRLRHSAPALGIFVVAKYGELSTSERQRLATVGVDRILDLEGLSRKRFGRLIDRRVGAWAPGRALAALSLIRLDPATAPLVHWTVRNACYRQSIEAVADLFWLSSRTVRRRFKRHGMPGYGALRSLGLQLHALELEVCRGHTRTEAARRLGYRDAAPLSRQMRSGSIHHHAEPPWFANLRELYL